MYIYIYMLGFYLPSFLAQFSSVIILLISFSMSRAKQPHLDKCPVVEVQEGKHTNNSSELEKLSTSKTIQSIVNKSSFNHNLNVKTKTIRDVMSGKYRNHNLQTLPARGVVVQHVHRCKLFLSDVKVLTGLQPFC